MRSIEFVGVFLLPPMLRTPILDWSTSQGNTPRQMQFGLKVEF